MGELLLLAARISTCSGNGGVVGTGEKPSRAKTAGIVGCASILAKFRPSTTARIAAANAKLFIVSFFCPSFWRIPRLRFRKSRCTETRYSETKAGQARYGGKEGLVKKSAAGYD